MKQVFIFVALLMVAEVAYAASFYVAPAPTGNNSNNGTSPATPKLNVQNAYDLASAGDTVFVAAGTYAESPRFDRSGTVAGGNITIDGQGVAIIRGWSLEAVRNKVINFYVTNGTTTFNPRVYVSQGGHFNIVTNNIFDLGMNSTVQPIVAWNGAASYPFGTAGSSNLFAYNTFRNIRDEMVFRVNGYQNTIAYNTITNTDNTDIFQLAGGTNYVIGNVVLSMVQLGVFTNNHADCVQMFGNAGGTSQSSWGHYIVSNLFYAGNANVNSELQIGNLTDDELNDVGNTHFWNNIYIGIAAKCSVAQPQTDWINNLFVSCATNSGNGGAALIFSDLNGVGHGDRGTMYNNIFLNCGIAGLTNNGNGWYHVDTTLTNMNADYNYVGKFLSGQYKAIEADSNHAHDIVNGGTWDANLWWEDHGINGGNPGFVNEAQLDFRLLATSILRDAGLDESALFTKDFRGVTRSAWDIGPYEFQLSDFNTYPCYISNRLINAYCVVATNATTINIPYNLVRTEATIERRTFGRVPSAWPVWTNIYTLSSASASNNISFTDTNISGVHYEYRISQLIGTNTICGGAEDVNGYRDYQVIDAGYRVPLIDTRGSVSLLVESNYNAASSSRIARLKSDLIGDGYKVYPHTNIIAVEATAGTTWTNAVWAVKQLIQTDYAVDTNTPLYVVIIGHVPVPYSGITLSPGSHSDNKGAHASDLFYADLNGTFTDASSETSADFPFTRNTAGDGKFDQDTIPSTPEVRIGRVDLRNMPAFGNTETQRLDQYLDRNHNWRHKVFTVRNRGLINDSGLGNTNSPGKPLESHGLFTGHFGNATATDLGNWLPTTTLANNYLFAAQQGSGHTNESIQMGTTDNFAATNLYAVFVSTYGSYYGSWDSGLQTNAFMQATLSGAGYTLATWYHENWMPIASSSMDEPIGYEQFAMQSQRFFIASGKEYEWYKRVVPFTGTFGVNDTHKMYESLLGDPTLRTRQVAPVSNLAVNASGSDNVLTWTASTDADVVGYHIYRASTSDLNNFTRLTSSTDDASPYTDTGAASGAYTYMVRAVSLAADTASRSFYTASQGVFVASAGGGSGSTTGVGISGKVTFGGYTRAHGQ